MLEANGFFKKNYKTGVTGNFGMFMQTATEWCIDIHQTWKQSYKNYILNFIHLHGQRARALSTNDLKS